jgi:hypothetical protein
VGHRFDVWLGLCLLPCNTALGSFGIVNYIFGINDHNGQKIQEIVAKMVETVLKNR